MRHPNLTRSVLIKPKRKLPTISKSGLVLSPCVYWANPDVKWYDEERVDREDLSARDNGIAFHTAMDVYTKTQSICVPKEEIFKLVELSINWYETELVPRCSQIISEQAIAVNWLTGEVRLLDCRDRKYPDWAYLDGWQPGTADLVCILHTGELLIADWKTGGSEGAQEQLMGLACGFQKVTKVLGSVDGQLQWERSRPVLTSILSVNENGVWPYEQPVSEDQIASHWDSMKFVWEDIIGGKFGTTKPGIHCTQLFCPHLAYCGAVTDTIRQLAAMDVAKKETDGAYS